MPITSAELREKKGATRRPGTERLYVAVLERFAVEHGDRDRCLLEVGLAALGSDDDLAEAAALIFLAGRDRGGAAVGGLLGEGGRCEEQRRCGGSGQG